MKDKLCEDILVAECLKVTGSCSLKSLKSGLFRKKQKQRDLLGDLKEKWTVEIIFYVLNMPSNWLATQGTDRLIHRYKF